MEWKKEFLCTDCRHVFVVRCEKTMDRMRTDAVSCPYCGVKNEVSFPNFDFACTVGKRDGGITEGGAMTRINTKTPLPPNYVRKAERVNEAIPELKEMLIGQEFFKSPWPSMISFRDVTCFEVRYGMKFRMEREETGMRIRRMK